MSNFLNVLLRQIKIKLLNIIVIKIPIIYISITIYCKTVNPFRIFKYKSLTTQKDKLRWIINVVLIIYEFVNYTKGHKTQYFDFYSVVKNIICIKQP